MIAAYVKTVEPRLRSDETESPRCEGSDSVTPALDNIVQMVHHAVVEVARRR